MCIKTEAQKTGEQYSLLCCHAAAIKQFFPAPLSYCYDQQTKKSGAPK
jgi:hypothetical protein